MKRDGPGRGEDVHDACGRRGNGTRRHGRRGRACRGHKANTIASRGILHNVRASSRVLGKIVKVRHVAGGHRKAAASRHDAAPHRHNDCRGPGGNGLDLRPDVGGSGTLGDDGSVVDGCGNRNRDRGRDIVDDGCCQRHERHLRGHNLDVLSFEDGPFRSVRQKSS